MKISELLSQRLITIIMVGGFLFNSHSTLSAKTFISELTCEYKNEPNGIDIQHPRFSWKLVSDAPGQYQEAYQILVASSPKLLTEKKADLWNSGKISSSQSHLVEYPGKPLDSGQKYWWKVRTWDQDGKSTGWSTPATFETGFLNAADWKAKWIKTDIEFDNYTYPSPLFRKEFTLDKEVASARLYITSLGLYECYLNGEKVGDQLFTPGWTSYPNRLQYQVYDVTRQLQQGNNAAGIMLGNGWYAVFDPNFRDTYEKKDLLALAQLEITFKDGTRKTIITDENWKSSTGGILRSEIYYGEQYDARMAPAGWNSAGFNDTEWSGVIEMEHPKNILTAALAQPVRATGEIIPVDVIYTPEGDTVLDMGQNMVGRCRINLNCPAGTTITLHHAEVLDKQGNFYTKNLRSAEQEVKYTCKGNGPEIYEPYFTFQGFRFVKVSGFPGEVTPDLVTGIVIHSDLEVTGSFSCNNDLINQLQHNILWGQKGNFLDVPTDCPQRNERLGWTGDAQVFAPTACFNMDCALFYTKWLKDLAADQDEEGAVPVVIPNLLGKGDAHGWADAATIVPWTVHNYYGDRRILEEQYASMKAWVDYMRNLSDDSFLWTPGYRQYGDWLSYSTNRSDYPGATTDKDLTANAYFFHSANLVKKAAELLGKKEDAEEYGRLMENIREGFIKEFVTPNGRLSSNTQTAYVVALSFDILPEEYKASAAKRLAEDVRTFGHITTGFLGTADICHVLTQYGYLDEAYMLLYRKEYPSWLYPVTRDATTIWERWDGIKPDGSFQNAGMNSFNHYAYGAIGSWLYEVVAGINFDPEMPGFKRIVFKPYPGGKMNDVSSSYESVYGRISSSWKITNGKMILEVEVPVNTSAEVLVPSNSVSLKINGKPVAAVTKISSNGTSYHFLKTQVGSGKYVFETDLKL